MKPMFMRLVAMLTAILGCGPLCAGTSMTSQQEAGTITVKGQGTSPDSKFALVFSRASGSISAWYDLDRDPKMAVNLGAVGEGNGFALFQNRAEVVIDGESIAVQPGPASRFTVVESSDVRVIVETAGALVDRTGHPPKMEMQRRLEMAIGESVRKTETPRYATRFTIYPTGKVYIRHVWTLKHNAVTLASNRVILGTAPTDRVVAMNEHGTGREAVENPASFVLHHGEGKPFNNDALLVPDHLRYRTDWLGQTMALRGRCGWTRSSFCIQDEKKTIRPGVYHWNFLLQVEPGTLRNAEAAVPYALDYQEPGVLTFPMRTARRRLEDTEDVNLDGFNESRGCYVMNATSKKDVTFMLDARKFQRHQPAFEIHSWRVGAPRSISIDGKDVPFGTDCNVHLEENVLTFQYLGVLSPGKHIIEVLPPTDDKDAKK